MNSTNAVSIGKIGDSSEHSAGLHLDIDKSGKPILTGLICGMEVTLSFAETEPAYNTKEICLAILTDRYAGHAVDKFHKTT